MTKLFKFKIFEKIYLYYHEEDENIQNAFSEIIFKSMRLIAKQHLKIFFDKLKNYNRIDNVVNEMVDELFNFPIDNNDKKSNNSPNKKELDVYNDISSSEKSQNDILNNLNKNNSNDMVK